MESKLQEFRELIKMQDEEINMVLLDIDKLDKANEQNDKEIQVLEKEAQVLEKQSHLEKQSQKNLLDRIRAKRNKQRQNKVC